MQGHLILVSLVTLRAIGCTHTTAGFIVFSLSRHLIFKVTFQFVATSRLIVSVLTIVPLSYDAIALALCYNLETQCVVSIAGQRDGLK